MGFGPGMETICEGLSVSRRYYVGITSVHAFAGVTSC